MTNVAAYVSKTAHKKAELFFSLCFFLASRLRLNLMPLRESAILIKVFGSAFKGRSERSERFPRHPSKSGRG